MKKIVYMLPKQTLKTAFIFLSLLLLTSNVFAAIYDWTGKTSTDVTVSGNWKNESGGSGIPGSGDDVHVGVSSSYNLTVMPVVTANTTWNSLTIGYYGPASNYTYGITYNLSLTVNSGITLTILTNITQNHDPAAPSSKYNFLTTTIEGAGTLLCQGNFIVGDAVTKPENTVADVTKVSLQINQLTISGNVVLNSNGNGINTPAGNDGICYPVFSVEKGTTTLLKQITFVLNDSPLINGYDTYNPPEYRYPGYGAFTADNTPNSPSTLELKYKQAIVPADHFYVYFTFGGNNGTVLYDDPNNENQTIYTANEPSATATTTYINTNAVSYYNLTFSGPSTKILDKNSTLGTTTEGLTTGGTWTTQGSTLNMGSNNPTVTIGGNWVNSTTVNEGTASVSVAGYIQNNTGNIINGNAATANTTAGGLINSGTITCNAENMTFTGAATNNSIITGGTGTLTFDNTYTNTSGSSIVTSTGLTYFIGNYTNNAGTLTTGTGNVYFDGNYSNNAGAIFTESATGMVYFNGANQTLNDNSTIGSIFNHVTFNCSGTATMTAGTGNFGIATTGVLYMASPATLIAGSTLPGGAGYLTLFSNATSSATIAQIPSGASIGGNVNVQRFLTGTNINYRGYRLLSSPVNNVGPTSSANNYINLYCLNKSTTIDGTTYNAPFTAGPGGTASGFTITNANPTIYLYDETLPSSNVSFIAGKNVGITGIGSNTVNSVTLASSSIASASVPATTSIPAANGYILYFVGDNTRASGSTSITPTNAYITHTGFINQQNVTVNLWYTPTGGASHLSYTSSLPTIYFPGYNMVGNPYPSTIDLKAVYSDNSSNNIGQIFYELDDLSPNNNYLGYNGLTGATSGTPATAVSEYVASGQGFLVTASSATASTLTFKETEKPTTVTNPSNLILANLPADKSFALQNSSQNILTGLHLRLQKDSATFDECGIYFGDSWSDKFDAADGIDLDGISPTVYMSSYTSDNIRTCINSLSDYTKGKRVKLFVKATTDGIYNLKLADILNIDTSAYNIYLLDHLKSDSLDIGRYKSYAFNITNSDTTTYGPNRLELAIERKPSPKYQLISFTAQKVKEGVLLTWKAENEGDYTGFGIQKQNAGNGQYDLLYTLQSSGDGTYTYIDHNPTTGNNIYRLKQIGIDSLISYSNAINILYNSATNNNLINIYPNPAKQLININFNTAALQTFNNYTAAIYNSMGAMVIQTAINNGSTITQDISTLKPGIYTVELKTGDGNSIGNSKFIKTN